ncbi:MAG: helix-turn-helix transcriptional regulator [Oscillospiraceae bacterium]|nr:helix-turn-helix transcriptional regulator [Oscillospiraceae bacterium]
MTFSERLKMLRCEKIPTITQKDLANALGITQRKVSFMETGTTEPSLGDIVALCKYFNVSADYLLGLPKNMNYPE